MLNVFARLAVLFCSSYLIFISIVATQIYEEKLSDLDLPKRTLESNLKAIISAKARDIKEASQTVSKTYATPDVEGLAEANPIAQKDIRESGDLLKIYLVRLGSRTDNFEADANIEMSYFGQILVGQNREHLGIRYENERVISLTNAFENWSSKLRDTAEGCAHAVSAAETQVRAFADKARQEIKKDPTGNRGNFGRVDANDQFSKNLIKSCDFSTLQSSNNIDGKIKTDDRLLPELMWFLSARWLIDAESIQLCIIVGANIPLTNQFYMSYINGMEERRHVPHEKPNFQ